MLLGDGAGGFTSRPLALSGANSVAVGDFNADGKQDLARHVLRRRDCCSHRRGGAVGRWRRRFHRGTGLTLRTGRRTPPSLACGGGLQRGRQARSCHRHLGKPRPRTAGQRRGRLHAAAGSPYATGGFNSVFAAAGDFNGDGRPDVAVANLDTGNVSVLVDVIASASVATGSASGVGTTTAILSGTVDPRDPDIAASYHFEYGTSTGYGARLPARDAPVDSAPGGHSVSQQLSRLQPTTTYHYRIVAVNPAGATYGQDQTFTTLGPPMNTSQPTITGMPVAGSRLACAPGSWSGLLPTFSYQWLRNGQAIRGATGPIYTATASDIGHLISCTVTATNSFGSTSARAADVRIADRTRPRVSAYRITPGSFRAERRGPSVLLSGKAGAKVELPAL